MPQAQQIFMATRALSYACFSSPCTAWGYGWAKACVCKSGILMRTGCGCKCETPKAIETALSRCRRTPCRYCAVSGRPTATPHCSSLTVSVDSKSPLATTRWIGWHPDHLAPGHPRLRFKKELRHTVCAIVMPPTDRSRRRPAGSAKNPRASIHPHHHPLHPPHRPYQR